MTNAGKTIPQILRDNICTVFNLLNLSIALALAAVGAWKNMLFLSIILINTAVGIVQEIQAKRQVGDRLLSGSTVISGKCRARATCDSSECFTAKMVAEVRKTRQSRSELLQSMKKVTRLTSFLIVPLGALLFVQAHLLRGVPLQSAVVSTAAGLLGMLPKGLVLLISVGLATGVIHLSRKRVLVRELHSLENLAHCDIVCLDKTGTLTEGRLTVEDVQTDIEEEEFERLIAA